MAVLFNDATSEYLQVSNGLISGLPVTMVCWFNVDVTAQFQALVALADSGQTDRYLILFLGNAKVSGVHRYDTTGEAVSSTGDFSADTWHHAGVVFAATNSRYAYLDGVESSEDTGGEADTESLDTFSIGRVGDSSPGGYVSGDMAEVAVWNVALTEPEMAILAAGYSPLFVRPGSLISYTPMIRLDGVPAAYDIVGGLTMTGFNTPQTSNHPRIIMPSEEEMEFVAAAVGGGLSIPVAMHYYRRMRGVPV